MDRLWGLEKDIEIIVLAFWCAMATVAAIYYGVMTRILANKFRACEQQHMRVDGIPRRYCLTCLEYLPFKMTGDGHCRSIDCVKCGKSHGLAHVAKLGK